MDRRKGCPSPWRGIMAAWLGHGSENAGEKVHGSERYLAGRMLMKSTGLTEIREMHEAKRCPNFWLKTLYGCCSITEKDQE